ncbi:hypothetical protein QZM62_15160 [Burkholderia multivorans]|nr:hypothetical protein [Burkholderia multivorans]
MAQAVSIGLMASVAVPHDRKAIGITQRQKMTTPERRIDRRNAMTHIHTDECPRRCAIFDIQTNSRFKDTREYRFSNTPRQATGMRNAREIMRLRTAQT